MSNPIPPKLNLSALAALLGQAQSAPGNQPMSPLVRALLGDRTGQPPSPLNSLGLLASPPPPRQTLGSLFGHTNAPGLGTAIPTPNTVNAFLLGATPPKIRRVFYSFHYQADIFRVNHIRKAGQFRTVDKWRAPTPQDRSLWEEAKVKNPGALMGMIDRGLEGTSVTCVLAGYETWSRPWVRYEIAKSVQRGNGLVVVTIHNCNCPKNGYALPGHNPLAQMAVGYDAQNRPRIYEWFNGAWRIFPRLSAPLSSWPKWLPVPQPGHVMQLSSGARCYDWITDGGADNLLHWTDAAAIAAGR